MSKRICFVETDVGCASGEDRMAVMSGRIIFEDLNVVQVS